MKAPRSTSCLLYLIVFVFFIGFLLLFDIRSSFYWHQPNDVIVNYYSILQRIESSNMKSHKSSNPRILISYAAYAPKASKDIAHKQCLRNMDFFLSFGVVDDGSVKYVFSLIGNTTIPVKLQLLARSQYNIEVVRGMNFNVDLYAHGDVISKYADDYDYFIFLNCGSRGPYYPLASATSPLSPSVTWTTILLSKLDTHIKLVGPTISCEKSPHVQTYVIAMDRIAVRIVQSFWSLDSSSITETLKNDLIDKSEIGLTAKFLHSGYGIASLDSRYLARNFSDTSMSCDPDNELVRGTIHANPTTCRYRPEDTGHGKYPISSQPGCLGQDPCEVVFIKYGGDALRLKFTPQLSIDRMKDEERYLYRSYQPYMCLRPVYPYRPYTNVSQLSARLLKPWLDPVQAACYISLYLNDLNVDVFLRNLSHWRSLYPESSIILAVSDSYATHKQLNHGLARLFIRDLHVIPFYPPKSIAQVFKVYSKKLCLEHLKGELIQSQLQAADRYENCRLAGGITPLQVLSMDILLDYFMKSSHHAYTVIYLFDYLSYADRIQSATIEPLHPVSFSKAVYSDSARPHKAIVYVSMPSTMFLTPSPLIGDFLPIRPRLDDYHVAIVKQFLHRRHRK
jgi:hypothetical protein